MSMPFMTPDQHKDAGNKAFKAQNYAAASQHYTEAINLIESLEVQEDLLPSLISNRSLCLLKQNKPLECCIDCISILTTLPTNHALYLKVIVRYASTQLLLSKDTNIEPRIAKFNKTNPNSLFPHHSRDALIESATKLFETILSHPDLPNSPSILQTVVEEIEKYALPLSAVPTTATTTTTPLQPEPTPKPPKKQIKLESGEEVENMTMADLERLNSLNQHGANGNTGNTGQPAPKLQGVWAAGGGNMLSAILAQDIADGPIVIKSKDRSINIIQREKNGEDGDNDDQQVPIYIQPSMRKYNNEELKMMISVYNSNNDQNIGYYGQFVDPADLIDDDHDDSLPADGQNAEEKTKTVGKSTKKQWHNASMLPRSVQQPVSDFDTASDGEHDDGTKVDEQNDDIRVVEPEQATQYPSPLDPNRFDNIQDDDSDEELRKVMRKKDNIRLNKQRSENIEKYTKNKIFEYRQIESQIRINHKNGHIHDGCLTGIKPTRIDDSVLVFATTPIGFMMVGKYIETPTEIIMDPTPLPFQLGSSETDIGNEQKETSQDGESNSPLQPVILPSPCSNMPVEPIVPGVITSDMYTKYVWDIPRLDSTSFLTQPLLTSFNPHDVDTEAPTINKGIHPSHTDMALAALGKTVKKVEKLNTELKGVNFDKVYAVEEFPSLRFARRVANIVNINLDLQQSQPELFWVSTEMDSKTNNPLYCVAIIPYDYFLSSTLPQMELIDDHITNLIDGLVPYFSSSSQALITHQTPPVIQVEDGTKPIALPNSFPFKGTKVDQFTALTENLVHNLTKMTQISLNNTQIVTRTIPPAGQTNKYYPFSTVETVVLSNAPGDVNNPAVLLVQRRIGCIGTQQSSEFKWGLPITHLDDADSIGFTSTRLIHSLFGALSETWSVIDITTSNTSIKNCNSSSIQCILPDPTTIPLDDEIDDDFSYYKGFNAVTITHVFGKTHRNTQEKLPENDRYELKSLSSYWPSRTKPALVEYQWFTSDMLTMVFENGQIDKTAFGIISKVFDIIREEATTFTDLVKLEWSKPNLSPAQQREIQKVEDESLGIKIPFGFGGLFSIENLTKQK
jgi:hypothetical protein